MCMSTEQVDARAAGHEHDRAAARAATVIMMSRLATPPLLLSMLIMSVMAALPMLLITLLITLDIALMTPMMLSLHRLT